MEGACAVVGGGQSPESAAPTSLALSKGCILVFPAGPAGPQS